MASVEASLHTNQYEKLLLEEQAIHQLLPLQSPRKQKDKHIVLDVC